MQDLAQPGQGGFYPCLTLSRLQGGEHKLCGSVLIFNVRAALGGKENGEGLRTATFIGADSTRRVNC